MENSSLFSLIWFLTNFVSKTNDPEVWINTLILKQNFFTQRFSKQNPNTNRNSMNSGRPINKTYIKMNT